MKEVLWSRENKLCMTSDGAKGGWKWKTEWGYISTSLLSGGWGWTSQPVQPCQRDEASQIRNPVDRNHPRSLARCDPTSYQDSLRGIHQITMRASSKWNWRPLLDTSEEERQVMTRGHTPWRIRFSVKENFWLYSRQFKMMTVTNAVPPTKLPDNLWTILQEIQCIVLSASWSYLWWSHTLLYRRFPDPDEYTDYLAMFESAKRKHSETDQVFAVRMTDLVEKAYSTLDWKVKDNNDPEKIYLGAA